MGGRNRLRAGGRALVAACREAAQPSRPALHRVDSSGGGGQKPFLRGPNVTVTVAVDGRAPTSANGQTRSKSNTSTVNIYTLSHRRLSPGTTEPVCLPTESG